MVTARKRVQLNTNLVQVSCLTTDSIGDAVYVVSVGTGGIYEVAKADPSSHSSMPAIGILMQKTDPDNGFVQFFGEIKGMYTGLTPGRSYFVGSNGRPSLTPPGPGVAPSRAYIQAIGIAIDSDVLLLNPHGSMVVRVAA